nr:hypothetical protein [uncultured Allomuricauda sp.]
MKNIFYILFFICTISKGQSIDRFTKFASQSSPQVQYYDNVAGAADPDSSTSTAGWVAGSGTVSASTEQARTGTHSLRQVSNGGLDNNSFDFSSGSNPSSGGDVSNGDIVDVTGWVWVDDVGRDIRIKITSSSISATQTISYTAGQWSQFTFTGVSITGSGSFFVYTNDDDGDADATYWDDITITKTN